MNMGIYSIYDDKAQIFATPFYMHNDAMATRAFVNLVQDENSTVSRNPEDYRLYHLGTFNDQDGVHQSLEIPKLLYTLDQPIDPAAP